ncbi:hypothetical protein [Nocardia concava]|nr:hypothetical protein [Nocardia concava]
MRFLRRRKLRARAVDGARDIAVETAAETLLEAMARGVVGAVRAIAHALS